jgi:hypothetical protein
MRHTIRHRSKSNAKTARRTQKGGDLAGYPASAWGWGNGTLGNGWTQFMNSLTLQPGQNLGTIQSNNIVPVGRLNAQDAQPFLKPNLTGGTRRKHHSKRPCSKKGGNLAAIVGDAVVPFALWGTQYSVGKSKKNVYNTHYKKNKSYRKH